MSNELKIFNNKEFGEIRTVMKNNEPWFVAKDVSEILGYARLDSMYKLIDKEDSMNINPQTEEYQGLRQNGVCLEPNENIFTLKLINESGLYQSIFNSKLESAKKFKKWVTSEVLPSIRKTGGYITPQLDHRDVYILDLAKAMQITNTVVTGMVQTVTRIEEFVKDSLNSKDIQIDKTAAMIGLRAKNTSMLSSALKTKLSDITGLKILGTSQLYEKFKFKVFREFNVTAWEQISIGNYNRAYTFIDSIESV